VKGECTKKQEVNCKVNGGENEKREFSRDVMVYGNNIRLYRLWPNWWNSNLPPYNDKYCTLDEPDTFSGQDRNFHNLRRLIIYKD